MMEFNIQRDVFWEVIQKTIGIVEKKTTIPIMNNILIKTEGNLIKVVATDKEITLLARYPANIIKEGSITISARKILEIVREIDGEEINVSVDEKNWTTITCQKVFFKIPGVPEDDFPSVADDIDEIELLKIDMGILKGLIDKTSFAMATDEIRRHLNGAMFEAKREEENFNIRMVATDGHRLSLMHAVLQEKFMELEKGIIIPRKGLSEIRKLLDGDNKVVFIGVQKGMCIIKKDNLLLKVGLIDADYPDYRKVIPKEEGIIIHVDRNTFIGALRRMNVMSSDKYGGVILTLAENKLVMNSTNPDIGEAKDEIDVVYNDNIVKVGYNVKYLIDAVEVIEEDGVIFEIRQGMKPSTIKAQGNDNYMCIIMPLKI